jgi:hypothetical protein
MFIIFWYSEPEPAIALYLFSFWKASDCSETFKDVKRSQSAAKSNAPEIGPPAWRRG